MTIDHDRAPRTTQRRHPIVWYVVIAYAVTWGITVPLITGDAPLALHLAVATGPTVAALVVTAIVSGRPGLRSLWDRMVAWRRFPSGVWWPIALSPLAYLTAVALAAWLIGGLAIDWEAGFGEEGWLVGLVGASLAFGIFEEIGWRGFLLPRLQVRHNAAKASLWLWMIWAGWHLPMFFYRLDFSPFMLVGWLVSLYFGTVFLTFLHNSTRGSLLAVILFHVSLDVASIMAGAISEFGAAAVSGLVIVATIVAARRTGSADLSRHGKYVIAD